jgi:hypothetical protein
LEEVKEQAMDAELEIEALKRRIACLERAFISQHGIHPKEFVDHPAELDEEDVEVFKVKGRGTIFHVRGDVFKYGHLYRCRAVIYKGDLYRIVGVSYSKASKSLELVVSRGLASLAPKLIR